MKVKRLSADSQTMHFHSYILFAYSNVPPAMLQTALYDTSFIAYCRWLINKDLKTSANKNDVADRVTIYPTNRGIPLAKHVRSARICFAIIKLCSNYWMMP